MAVGVPEGRCIKVLSSGRSFSQARTAVFVPVEVADDPTKEAYSSEAF